MKCLYCNIDNKFNKEHVIPKFLGTYSSNPTLKDVVCEVCNSSTFSKLEVEFKEDSYEGVFMQMLNLTNSNSVRIRGENTKMKCLGSFGDDFFDEIFPFLKRKNGSFVITVKPQIKFRNYAGEGGYQIFLLEALEKIIKNKRKFEKIKERISKTDKNNIAIFTRSKVDADDTNIDSIISLLKEYGIFYDEKERKYALLIPSQVSHLNFECKITKNICRVIAKIAFNYFAYCAAQEGMLSILYKPFFNNIKEFILGKGKTEKKDVIIEYSREPIHYSENLINKRLAGHTIVFYEEEGFIYSRVSFLSGQIYKVLIGDSPKNFQNEQFGCGHIFLPFAKQIYQLTQKINKSTSEEIKEEFGLFRRLI